MRLSLTTALCLLVALGRAATEEVATAPPCR
jgi:hypothetical protein